MRLIYKIGIVIGLSVVIKKIIDKLDKDDDNEVKIANIELYDLDTQMKIRKMYHIYKKNAIDGNADSKICKIIRKGNYTIDGDDVTFTYKGKLFGFARLD